ncbi:hypothetical protein CLU79DRAFT_677609, partial [Phycomyces nitens]
WKNRWQIKRFDYWPSQSPNLNPIEHVRKAIKDRVVEQKAYEMGCVGLCNEVVQTKMDPEFGARLVASMSDRIKAVIAARGG